MSQPARRVRSLLAIVMLSLLLSAGTPAGALPPETSHPDDGLGVALEAMHQLATHQRDLRKVRKTVTPKRGLPVKLGKDGRLTVLLLGSDFRRASPGERLDVIMVATIDPVSGKAAVVSIPRDMSGIPLKGGGNSGSMRVNSIYYLRYRDPSLKHGRLDRTALKRFSKDIGAFLGTEIDYWALTRFDSFNGVVNALGGLRIDIDEAVLDSSFHHGSSRGIWFPKAKAYRLRGNPKCKPKPRKCRSALVYARSRKGTMGKQFNSDYRRAERQQDIVHAGVRKVLDQTGSGIALLGTLLLVRQHVKTNIPTTAEAAGQLYALLSKLRLPRANQKVLAPATWAVTASDGSIKPKLSTIRRWVRSHFYKVRPKESENG